MMSETTSPRIAREIATTKTDFASASAPVTATVTDLKPHFIVRHSTTCFFVIGVLFLFAGSIILSMVRDVREIAIDYTNCQRYNESNTFCENVINAAATSAGDDGSRPTCVCEISFRVDEEISEPVNVYYALTNFYQNHRSYVLSKDENQLGGKLSEEVAAECKPYERNVEKKVIAPCGAIANSFFNDTITLYSIQLSSFVPLLKRNLIWPRIKRKFRNPSGRSGSANDSLATLFRNFSRPPAWRKNIWELDPDDPSNNGFENEDLIVWMQPATMPNFRKLYRRVDHNDFAYVKGLPRGEYKLRIDYAYPVNAFNGRKSVIISNTSAFGGKNMFLVYSSFTLAAVCIFAGFIFALLKRLRRDRVVTKIRK